ncbi:alkaline phosphatase D family protein [Algoriphagus sp. PAP.12]|uniref:alkaline phosphatase D family protein n=1 Tax=Algoriphagus sp. PAP.12 TaxID=2996678 RepID=UPI00227C4D0A|nr:alkaline phosphatase D family protein [Algoriphagus sp. PAP.12]
MQTRRSFFKNIGWGIFSFSIFSQTSFSAFAKKLGIGKKEPSVFFTTGFKLMEVTDHSVLVWTRVCKQAEPNPIKHQRKETVFRHPIDFDEFMPVSQMDGGVEAGSGYVQVQIQGGGKEWTSDWLEAKAEDDFTVKAVFDDLPSATTFRVILKAKSKFESREIQKTGGEFTTAPNPDQIVPVLFTTSTCQYFWSFDDEKRGFQSYDSMGAIKPDFFIQTGDYIYYDKPGPMAKNLEQARHKWHAMDAWPSLKDLFRQTPLYMMKDDHDLLRDDAHPASENYGDLTFADGIKLWYQNVPLEKEPYRTIRWGKDLQVWMVEGREFRTPNPKPDGPDKSIWGKEQMDWFKESVEASDASFKILVSATPIVGPDRENKKDNHANSVYHEEGEKLRKYLSQIPNLFVVNGDRHWQYVSKDLETGLMEFCSGPISDYHSQGWDADDYRPEHQFLRLKGGFLSVKVERISGQAQIFFAHRDVKGEVVHEEGFKKI